MPSLALPLSLAENPQVVALIDDLGLVPSCFAEEFEQNCASWRNNLANIQFDKERSDYYDNLLAFRKGLFCGQV